MDALSAQGNLSEARPAAHAYNLDGEGTAFIVLTTTEPSAAGSNQTCRFPQRRWVHSREHTRVNSGERQGHAASPNLNRWFSTEEEVLGLLSAVQTPLKEQQYSHTNALDRRVTLYNDAAASVDVIWSRRNADDAEIDRTAVHFEIRAVHGYWRIISVVSIPTDKEWLTVFSDISANRSPSHPVSLGQPSRPCVGLEADFVVLVHGHRNFGANDGAERGDVDPWQEIADSISFLEDQPEVGAAHIGICPCAGS